jgi:hypothetical protein
VNLYGYAGNDPVNRFDPMGADNCEVTPDDKKKNCIGDDDAPPDTAEENEKKDKLDEVVVSATKDKSKLKGDVYKPGEVAFIVDGDELTVVSFMSSVELTCAGGGKVQSNTLDPKDVARADALGHTHGSDLVPGIGPDDVATAKSAGVAPYVVYQGGISVVENVGGKYRARLVSGDWGASKSSIQAKIKSINAGGSGKMTQANKCVPTGK